MTEKGSYSKRQGKWKILAMPFVVLLMSLVSVVVSPSQFAQAHPVHQAQAAQPAHGAMTSPASRTYACFLEDPQNPTTPACQAAISVGGTQPLYDWFAVRSPLAAGRTVGYIPDGHLCSGGNPIYAAYDAARADWPATNLQAGTQYTFVYGAWVPHPGSFRFYITKDGYDPTQPLTWNSLEAQPFLTANPEPAVVNGAYNITGMLPAGKTGRHIIYSVWTRSDSPETFYGCSDVIFGKDGVYPTPTLVPVTCTVVVSIDNTWQGGFQSTVKVTNKSSAGLIPWVINWNEPTGVALINGWNATVTQDSTKIIADAPDWQRTFQAGATVSIGFVATGSSVPPPSGVMLNGVACT